MAQKKTQSKPQGNEKIEALEQRIDKLEAALRDYFQHTGYDRLFKI